MRTLDESLIDLLIGGIINQGHNCHRKNDTLGLGHKKRREIENGHHLGVDNVRKLTRIDLH